jgi:hypothetical protein
MPVGLHARLREHFACYRPLVAVTALNAVTAVHDQVVSLLDVRHRSSAISGMPSPWPPRMSQALTVTSCRHDHFQAHPDSPDGVSGLRMRPGAFASMTAAASCLSGLVKRTQNRAAFVRWLIQVLMPMTCQLPSSAGQAVAVVA